MNRFRQFIFNGILLTAVSLAMRAVGVSFNVYISNKIGAEAMGLFTLISTVYGFALTFAVSGIGLASTKLISEAMGVLKASGIMSIPRKTRTVSSVVRKCVIYSLFFSSLSTILLYLLAPVISLKILDDPRCISSLRILAFTLIPISLSSVLSGYFTAVRRVYKNAITQIAEQSIKIFASAYLLTFLFAESVESACICIVLGAALAEIISFLIQLALYFLEKKYDSEQTLPPQKAIGSRLLSIALPLAFSAYLRSALITIEHILIPIGLQKSGASRGDSLAAYGIVQSMVFPIVFFPSAILSSFSSLLVPEISEAMAAKRHMGVKRIISNVFEVALIFAIGTAGIMLFFSYELGNMIYPGTDAGKYIKMIAPLIPIMYIDTATDAMLKGLGEQVYSMGVNIVDSLLSVILVIVLLPIFGIDGYIMTVYFTETVNATLSITRLWVVSGERPKLIGSILKPLGCVILSSAIVKQLCRFSIFSPLSGSYEVIVSIALTIAIYLLFIIISGSAKSKKIKNGFKLLRSR